MLLESWFWIFNAVVLILLSIDLLVFHRHAHEIRMKEALWLSLFWIGLALLFNIWIYYHFGKEDALAFLTGYLVEKSLSVDNLFVFLLIFNYFQVPRHLLHKVLFWGVIGAIIARTLFILFGLSLLKHFDWIIYVFGALLIYTGVKLGLEKDQEVHPEKNVVIKLFQRFFPVVHQYYDGLFFVKLKGRYFATPLFVTLLAIETTDIIFAVDSIPAIIGITQNPFIVYTSNILAILGLRSLYFALSHMFTLFHYLHYGLAFILVFIGVKMVGSHFFTISTTVSLSVVLGVLAISVLASLLRLRRR